MPLSSAVLDRRAATARGHERLFAGNRRSQYQPTTLQVCPAPLWALLLSLIGAAGWTLVLMCVGAWALTINTMHEGFGIVRGADAFCTSSTLDTTIVGPSTAPSSNAATGCSLMSGKQLTLSGLNIPELSAAAAGAAVAMSFVGGSVLGQGMIAVRGPAAVDAATKVPMRVLIYNNNFANGAAVLVTGSYPPNSNVTISGNRFVSTQPCALMTVLTQVFVTVIAYIDTVPIVLGAGASIVSQYNTIDTNSGTTIHSIPFVVHSISFNNGSSAGIRGNSIKSHGFAPLPAQNTWVLLFDTGKSYVMGGTEGTLFRYLTPGAEWAFDDNTIYVTNENPNLAFVGNAPYVNAPSGGAFVIRRNFLEARPLTSGNVNNWCFSSSSGNTAANFTFRFEGNTVIAYGNNNMIATMGFTQFSGASLVSFVNNTITSAEATTGVRVQLTATVYKGTSRLIVEGNHLYSSVGATRLPAFMFMADTRFEDSSFVSFVGNSLDANIRTVAAPLLASEASSVYMSPAMRIVTCGSRFNGMPVRNRLLFNQIAADATVAAMPMDYCGQTVSESLIPTASVSHSSTASLTVSESLTTTVSASPSASASATLTATESLQATVSATAIATVTASLSPPPSTSASLLDTPTHSTSLNFTDTAAVNVTGSLMDSSTPSISLAPQATPSQAIPATPSVSAPATMSPSASLQLAATASSSTSASSSPIVPKATRTASASSTLYAFPESIPNNAPGEDTSVAEDIAAAAQEVLVPILPAHAAPRACRRLELLLLGSSVLAPILPPADHVGGLLLSTRSYGDALATSGLVLLLAAVAGLFVTLALMALRVRQNGLAIGAAAVAARFPATAFQCLIFLSPGAAVASGLALGYGRSLPTRGDDSAVAAAIGLVALVGAPVGWALLTMVAVRYAVRMQSASKTSGKFGGRTSHEGGGGGLFLVVADANATTAHPHRSADDEPLNRRGGSSRGCIGGRALLCGGVRPLTVARGLGPVVGDLGGCYPRADHDDASVGGSDGPVPVGAVGAALRSLVPAALPLTLLLSALIVGATGSCEHMPVVAAVLALLYAALIATLRPFTGYSHNGFEALWSVVAAIFLVWLYAAILASQGDDEERWASFARDGSKEGGTMRWADAFSSSERAAVTCLGGLLSCRYPFVLARALGVGMPRVVAVLPPVADADAEEGGEGPEAALLVPGSSGDGGYTPEHGLGDAYGYEEEEDAHEGEGAGNAFAAADDSDGSSLASSDYDGPEEEVLPEEEEEDIDGIEL